MEWKWSLVGIFFLGFDFQGCDSGLRTCFCRCGEMREEGQGNEGQMLGG